MYFTPTIFMAQLLAAMQVLMTLDMPLSTTMALPVTSKPIESTVENLAWQAWIELPPEQKQQVKSRKVTPKSIFTLPLRVECPEGHKQVDTKCIPIVIGSNDVLIDLNALGLLVGNTQPDDIYDYDDMGEEMGSPLPYGSDMPQVEAEKSVEGITVELKPPSKDEPLKFNIFQNKFNIFHEEPMEDYSALSNEGLQSSEKEQNTTESNTLLKNETLTAIVANATAINDLLGEASNISEHNFEIYVQNENNSSERPTLSTLANDEEFKIDAISLPASGFDKQTSNTLAVIQNDSSIQLVTSIMDTEGNSNNKEENDKPQENDIQKLLQTESFLPTTTTLKDQVKLADKASLSTVADSEPSESSPESLNLNVDDDEMTTLPSVMEGELKEMKEKQEYTRSVTMNPLIAHESDSNDVTDNDNNSDNNDQVNDTTLDSETNDEPLETTTPIQLDDTTVIETSSSLSSTPATQQELKELLMQQEQAQKDFEELQRMRKGQKDQNKQQEQQHQQQHIVSKKSKVEPVEVLSATETQTTDNNMPTETTKSENELLLTSTTTATVETVTPLLTVHNENDNNNDRFYYQHFAKQDLDLEQKTQSATAAAAALTPTQTTATKITEIETIPLTSEIDLAEELRLINEMVKGINPATTLTTIKTMQTSSTTTTTTTSSSTTTTTEKPSTNTLKTQEIQSSSDENAAISESSSVATKPTPSTLQIWSKIMPLLTTSTTATPTITTPESSSDISNDIQNTATTTLSSISTRSNRNSKIIRLNGFNSISSGKRVGTPIVTSTAKTTTTTEEDSSTTTTSSSSTSSSSSSSSDLESSSTENNTYEPYWWLPVAWRLDKPTSTEKHLEAEEEVKSEEQPLLLRFWSAYHAPKSS